MPRLNYSHEDTHSLVQENLSEFAVRSHRHALAEIRIHLPVEVAHVLATGFQRSRGPCRRGRRWQRAWCGRCKLYVRLSRRGQPSVRTQGDRDTIPKGPG
jgi:hypothetical protein